MLLLHSFGRNFQAEDVFGDYLRTDLAEKSPYPLDTYEVLLKIARFSDGERDDAFVGYLRGLFATHPPDLIVTSVSPFWPRPPLRSAYKRRNIYRRCV